MAFFFFSESLCGAKNRESDSLTKLRPRVTHVKAGHKVLEVGREEVPLACFGSRVQVAADLNLLRTSSSISGAKAKNLTLRHPMNNSHVADPSQASYTIPTQTL